LVYYLYRFYDPNLQRWVNQDPIGERGGINLYAFAGGDPVNRADPNGEVSIVVWVIGGAVVVLAGWALWEFAHFAKENTDDDRLKGYRERFPEDADGFPRFPDRNLSPAMRQDLEQLRKDANKKACVTGTLIGGPPGGPTSGEEAVAEVICRTLEKINETPDGEE